MVEKVARYAILSFFSFCFFTFVFHAAASTGTASQGSILFSPTPSEIIPSPTPTIFVYQGPTAAPDIVVTLTPTLGANLPHALAANIPPTVTSTPALSTATPIPTDPIPTELPPTSVPTSIPTLTPTLQPSVTILGTTDLDTLFTTYSTTYHVDKALLQKIAQCESGFNSNALNGDYTGMFQFATSSWISVRTTMGLDTNPDLRKNPEEAIRTAAFMLSQGRASAWPTCSR